MSIYTHVLDAPMPEPCRGGAVTIGNFDGVHLGHQTLLAETLRQSHSLKVPAVAVTFDPHPATILRPDLTGPFLTTIDDRAALLTQFGMDHVLILQTTPALLQLSARDFFEKIIIDQLRIRALIEGFNFGFGHNREGTTETLRAWCHEKAVPLTLAPPHELLGQPVSSSRVRADLLAGKVDLVQQLLGRPYRVTGVVGTGAKRGATLGFPTANLHDIATLIPDNGVYAVMGIVDGVTWPGAANVGPNPTFGETARKVEVHLIGFDGTLYGKSLSVDFVQKIRDTKPFSNSQELVAQIQKDIAIAKTIVPA